MPACRAGKYLEQRRDGVDRQREDHGIETEGEHAVEQHELANFARSDLHV